MEVVVSRRSAFHVEGEATCLVLVAFEGEGAPESDHLRAEEYGAFRDFAARGVLRGKAQEVVYLPTPVGPFAGVLVAGLGKRARADAEARRRAAGKVAEVLTRHRLDTVVLDVGRDPSAPAEALLEGLALGQYRFDRYKSREPGDPQPTVVERAALVHDDDTDPGDLSVRCQHALAACANANWARDLACTPANELTPTALADHARGMAREAGLKVEVLHEDDLARLGMNALLGVARGSEQRATLTRLHYTHPEATTTLALAGKGMTFDSGGISLKPGEGMHEMKYDMCGAAAVLGAMKTIAALRPAVNVVAAVPAAENMPGGNALRPGDIVKACNGKTIEVLNTDAEGRLILADALAYLVTTYAPSRVVDVATLTGAAIVALGHYAAAVMSNDDGLWQALQGAADATGERVWRLPLWEDYDRLVEGQHADLSNIGPPREAGPIMGGAFLKAFVGETPWAHLDIAGPAWGGKHIAYLDPQQPTGYGVRLLSRWVLDEAGRAAAAGQGK